MKPKILSLFFLLFFNGCNIPDYNLQDFKITPDQIQHGLDYLKTYQLPCDEIYPQPPRFKDSRLPKDFEDFNCVENCFFQCDFSRAVVHTNFYTPEKTSDEVTVNIDWLDRLIARISSDGKFTMDGVYYRCDGEFKDGKLSFSCDYLNICRGEKFTHCDHEVKWIRCQEVIFEKSLCESEENRLP